MQYEYLKNIKKNNQTIKLLNSDNFAMMVSFFYFVFYTNKHISITHTNLLNYLDDFLFDINQTYDNIYPKKAKEYLDDFVSDKNAYLKKYQGSDDEAMYELTPYTQKTFEFLESLEKKEFVGSRTKFNIIFELLEELEFETNLSDEERIKSLQEQKDAIDAKIKNIQLKKDVRFDNSRIKEHFMLIEEQSRKLKYDFSQIEYNFRELNQKAMEHIATAYESKDSVLGSIFDIEDSIRQSDQGKSFFAFWQILTDAQKNEKLSTMLEKLYDIEIIQEFDSEERLKNLKYDLLLNADKIGKISSKLIEQLRRFLDDRVWIENKKILELCNAIEKKAVEIKENPPLKRDFHHLAKNKVAIDSVFEKSLYTLKENKAFSHEIKEDVLEVNLDAFYDIFFIDEALLQNNINYFLQIQSQCTLVEVLEKFPIEKGISELIGYLSIAKNSKNSIVAPDEKQKIHILGEDGNKKIVSVAKILFTKGTS
ncbi:MAG: DUF3375 domain-containing protein [Helicobacteraceae bacterium]|nr:DUF3375 domain-containing protein [Candidatus Sulfurimonas ponti]